MQLLKARIALLVLVLVAVWTAPAFAYKFWGSKPLAMGGAYTAVANDANAISWNPAGLTWFNGAKQANVMFNWERHQYLFGDYSFAHPELQPEEEDDFFHDGVLYNEEETTDPEKRMIDDWYRVSMVDGYTTKYVAAGFALTSMNFPNRTFQDGTDYSIDLAVASGMAELLSFGITGRYISMVESSAGQFNMDVGALLKPGGFLGIGLVGRNLIGSEYPRLVRREIAFGLAGFILNYATVSFDIVKVFDVTDVDNTINFAVGAEGIVAKVLAIRGGFNWDQVDQSRLYSVGIGYVDKMGQLTYTFQGSVDEYREFAHSLQIAISFP